MRTIWIGLVGMVVVGVLQSGARAEPEWWVGTGSVKITPEKPIPLAGYASRTKPFEKVDHDIYAKALAIRDAGGSTAILVTIDICIMPGDVARPVAAKIAEMHKRAPGAVVLNLSHTHSGPAVSLAGEGEGGVNPSSGEIIEYTKSLQQKLIDVAGEAVGKLKPATLSWNTGVAHFAMNRRQFTDKGVILGVNARGMVDRSVPVLRMDGEDGKPIAILFGYACHGTTLPPSNMGVNPDYPGYARDAIEEKFPGAQAFFMQGCAGDANPYPRTLPELATRHGKELGEEVCRLAAGGTGAKLTAVHGPLKVALENAALPLQVLDRPALEELAKAGSKKADALKMIAMLEKGQKLPETYTAPVTAWQFGGDLTMVHLPNEVVVDYMQKIEEAAGPLRLWVAGYSHHVEGYIPSRRVIKEGGYETRGLYIGTGWFAPGVEEALVEAAKSAAGKAGRKMDKAP